MLNALDRLGKDEFISNRRYRELGSPSNLRRMVAKFGRYKVFLFNLKEAFVQSVHDNHLSMYALIKAQADTASRLEKSLLDAAVYKWDQEFFPVGRRTDSVNVEPYAGWSFQVLGVNVRDRLLLVLETINEKICRGRKLKSFYYATKKNLQSPIAVPMDQLQQPVTPGGGVSRIQRI